MINCYFSVCSSEYEFGLECGITKPAVMMHLADIEDNLSSLLTLCCSGQLRRGLHTLRFSVLMESYPFLFKQLFLHSNTSVTADFIQDLFQVDYSVPVSNNRVKEEAIMMNWVSYLLQNFLLSVHPPIYL